MRVAIYLTDASYPLVNDSPCMADNSANMWQFVPQISRVVNSKNVGSSQVHTEDSLTQNDL